MEGKKQVPYNLIESTHKDRLTVEDELSLVFLMCKHFGYEESMMLKSPGAKLAMDKAANELCRSTHSIHRYMRCYLMCSSYPEINDLVKQGKLNHSVLDHLVTVPGEKKVEAAKKVSGMNGRDAIPILNQYKGI